MSRGVSIQGSELVARSLKMTRSTNVVVASVAAAVASNATVAMQFTGTMGQLVLASLIFVTVGAGVWAVSVDIYSRSSLTLTNLRSIGATRGNISSAILVPILLYGIAGSVIGAVVGAAVGVILGGTMGFALATEAIIVIVACSAASAAGVFAGGRAAWRS